MDILDRANLNPTGEAIDRISDNDWVKSTFILGDTDINNSEYGRWLRKNRYRGSADYKFTSTSPGMSLAVNPKPQACRYSDPRSKGKLESVRPGNITPTTLPGPYGLGLGYYYSEAIDDNAQTVFFRFGIPSFTPFAIWASEAFDIKRTIIASRGVVTGTLLEIVDWLSSAFMLFRFPLITLGAAIFKLVTCSSRFYSLKPTMYLYWATVEDILNSLVARRTLLPNILPSWSYRLDNKIGQEKSISSSFIKGLNELIPDIVDKDGRISVFGIALKAQSMFNRVQMEDYQKSVGYNMSSDFTDYPVGDSTGHSTYFTNRKGSANFTSWLLNKVAGIPIDDASITLDTNQINQKSLIETNDVYTKPDGSPVDINLDPNDPNDSVDQRLIDNFKLKETHWEKYKDYMVAEFAEGAAFAVFQVESTGSVSESFGNSFATNPVESTFNSISAKARSLTTSLGGIAAMKDIPVIGSAIDLAVDSGMVLASNASGGLINPLLALLYGVNIEAGKVWESSDSSMPRGNYKIHLNTPYGDPYSQLFSQYLPLSMILAGALPRSTGASTHQSPFLCQVFDKGRFNCSLGAIKSLNITRGTGNLPFSRTGHANGISVEITIESLDELASVDIASGGVVSNDIENVKNLITRGGKEGPFTDYLNTIAGLDVYHQVNGIPKLRLALSESMLKLGKYWNGDPAAFAAFTVDKVPFGNMIFKKILGNNAAVLNDLTRGF